MVSTLASRGRCPSTPSFSRTWRFKCLPFGSTLSPDTPRIWHTYLYFKGHQTYNWCSGHDIVVLRYPNLDGQSRDDLSTKERSLFNNESFTFFFHQIGNIFNDRSITPLFKLQCVSFQKVFKMSKGTASSDAKQHFDLFFIIWDVQNVTFLEIFLADNNSIHDKN